MISVGIDISKDKSTVCMLRPYGEVVEAPHSIDHTEQALNALIEHSMKMSKSCLKQPAAIIRLLLPSCSRQVFLPLL